MSFGHSKECRLESSTRKLTFEQRTRSGAGPDQLRVSLGIIAGLVRLRRPVDRCEEATVVLCLEPNTTIDHEAE